MRIDVNAANQPIEVDWNVEAIGLAPPGSTEDLDEADLFFVLEGAPLMHDLGEGARGAARCMIGIADQAEIHPGRLSEYVNQFGVCRADGDAGFLSTVETPKGLVLVIAHVPAVGVAGRSQPAGLRRLRGGSQLAAPVAWKPAFVVVAQPVEATEEQRAAVQQGDELGERHVMPNRTARAPGLRERRMFEAFLAILLRTPSVVSLAPDGAPSRVACGRRTRGCCAHASHSLRRLRGGNARHRMQLRGDCVKGVLPATIDAPLAP